MDFETFISEINFQQIRYFFFILYDEYIAHSYARNSLEISRGSGALCADENGRPLIDFSSGIGVNSLGFVNKTWVNAVKSQLDTLAHTSNLYYTRPQAELAQKLCGNHTQRRAQSLYY